MAGLLSAALVKLASYRPASPAVGNWACRSWGQYRATSLTCGLLLVASEHLQLLLQVPDVKEFAEVVPGRRQQPVPVQVPLHLHHRVLVGVAVDRQVRQ